MRLHRVRLEMSSRLMMSGSRTTSTGVVRGSVEETLNALLDAEADQLCNALRYERTEARRDTRAGHYERKLQTKAGEVKLQIPKLRTQTFETAIIERYRRRESLVEEALIEMYLAGVPVRRVEDITEALWGTRVSPSTVSDLNKKIYGTIEALAQPADRRRTPLRLPGRHRAQAQLGGRGSQRVAVGAIAVNGEGYREILGICEGAKEDKAGWSAFLKHLKGRGVHGIRLIISDACMGLAESAAEFFPEARCIVHWYRRGLQASQNEWRKFGGALCQNRGECAGRLILRCHVQEGSRGSG